MFCVHDQGGVAFQQSSGSPHASQECVDSLETRDGCLEETQRDSLDIRELGFTPFSTKENKAESNDRLDALHYREGDGGPSLGCESTASPLHNGNSEDQRAWACENSRRDYAEREESLDVGVVSTGDSSDGSHSESEGESLNFKAPSCGRQREETDKADDFICETSGWAEGPEEGNQTERPNSEEKQLSEFSHTGEPGDMGITQSLDTEESSDVESCSQGAETDDEDGFVDALGPEKVKEEELLDLNPVLEDPYVEDIDRNGSLINSEQNKDCLEFVQREDFRDETSNICEPETLELKASESGEKDGVCDIFCNVDHQCRFDFSEAVDHDNELKLFEDAQEWFLTERNESQEKLSDMTLWTVHIYEESSLQSHTINQELFPVEKTILDPMVEDGEKDKDRCIDIFQIEPESHTPTSEDTLEPEDPELASSDRFLIGCGNLDRRNLCDGQPTLEEALESSVTAHMEIMNVPDECPQDQTQSNDEVTSQTDFSEDAACGVFQHKDKSGDQGNLTAFSDKLDESKNTKILEDRPSSLVHNDHVGAALHVHDCNEDKAGLCPKEAQVSEVEVCEVAQPISDEDQLKGEFKKDYKLYL